MSFHPRTNSTHNPSHNSKLFLETGFKYKYVHRTLRRPYLPALSSRCSCRPGGVSNCCPSTTVAAKDRNGPRGRLREIIYGRVRLRARGSRPFKPNNRTSRRRCSSHGRFLTHLMSVSGFERIRPAWVSVATCLVARCDERSVFIGNVDKYIHPSHL